MHILVINGPNLNMLGIREPDIYGTATYDDLVEAVTAEAQQLGIHVSFVQSNSEGALVDAIQGAYGTQDGIIINPAAYTHTSVALLDALKAVGLPAIEVHLSDPDTREDFRRISFVREACIDSIRGRGFEGYLDALRVLHDAVAEKSKKLGKTQWQSQQ